MGPCQGFPCLDKLAAVLAQRTGEETSHFNQPTYRTPRAANALAQAAGLAGLVEPERNT